MSRNASGMFYLLTDHLGSVVAVLDATGAAVSEQRYRPFGQPRPTPGITQTDRGYTGQQSLSAAGLVDFNARWVDSSLGMFASPDSLVQYAYSPQALNRYSYVLNNPLTYSDPTGHRACEGPMGECWYTDPDPNIGTMPVRGWEPDPAGSSASGGGVTANQQEGVPGMPLEDWEVDLLAATIMAETRMGRWDNNTQRLIAWVMLNRLSLGTHRSLWLAVKGVQSAVSCLYESDSERCRGSTLVVPFGGDPEAWTFAVTDALSSGNYPSYPLTRQLAGEVYHEWLEYGTYSAQDPTGGMVDFSIVSPEDRSSGDPNTGGNERTQAWRASRWPGYRYQYLPEDGPLYLEGIEGGRYILIYNKLLTIPPDAY